jgi:hypothetical protein
MANVSIGEIAGNGFQLWKKNLILCIPFILGTLITGMVALCIMLPTMFALFFPMIQQSLTNTTAVQSPEFAQQMLTLFIQNLWLVICVLIIIGILAGFIMSFFTAGAIGMAKEAILTGKTTLDHMTQYGKKKFISFFGVSLITGLVLFVGVVFLIPGILSLLANLDQLTSQTLTATQVMTVMIPFIGGLILMAVYMLPMSIILVLGTYAVVIDDLSAMDGFKKGIHVMWQNKVNTFLLWLLILAISVALSFLGIIPFIGSLLMLVIMFLIVMPLTTLWWTQFYINCTKIQTN